MEVRNKTRRFLQKGLCMFLAITVSISGFSVSNIFETSMTVFAKELTGISSVISAPSWNAANIPDRDTSSNTVYWYAGNGFYALNQLSDGVGNNTQNTWYPGAEGGISGVSGSGKDKYLSTNDYSANAYQFEQTLKNDNAWELMDTDAVWDDEYLWVQYAKLSDYKKDDSFNADILATVNRWYNQGFTGDSKNGASFTPKNTQYFSDAEKNAVLSANLNANGKQTKGSNKVGGTNTIKDAHLFAPSVDELYYNKNATDKTLAYIHNDYSNVRDNASGKNTTWYAGQYARYHLWSRSFWGVNSDSCRRGFSVHSAGPLNRNNVAHEFAVAPAFYLDLEKVIMARSALAGTQVPANSGLAAYNPNSINDENGIKFLVKDNDFAPDFKASIDGKLSANIVPGTTYTVSYNNASKSFVNEPGNDNNAKLVISAAIYDSAGKIKYYGPLRQVDNAAGVAQITIPEDLDGTYTLAIFEEQLGGTSSWNTHNNSNNGSTFYGTGNNYKAYETDYMSGAVSYMTFKTSTDEFEVSLNDGGTMYAGSTFNADDMDQIVSATVGSTSLTAGEYYFMDEESFNDLPDMKKSTVSTLLNTNNLTTPAEMDNPTDIPVYFLYYASQSATAQIVVLNVPCQPDRIENAVDFDSNIWYQSTENGITWNYKLDGNGDIIGLYTEDSVTPIIDGGNSLNIPAKVAGRTVVAIGGGTEETPVVPSSMMKWKSLSLPSTVTTINDYAFFQSAATDASIVIPSTVTKIGIKAFYNSAITSFKVNEMNGTIGSLAFGNCNSLETVTLNGGKSGLTISTIAFKDSGAMSVTIKGKVDINKNAFKDNLRLANISISGNVNVGDYAFTGCKSVTAINISQEGSTNIGEYSFNNNTSLEKLYLPKGSKLSAYSFNGCTALATLESDVNLVNKSFDNCDKITTLILDKNCRLVEYDWEGHCGSYSSRKVYVMNKDTEFEFYGKDGTYYSSYGSAGNIKVTYPKDGTDQGMGVEAHNDILTLKTITCGSNASYESYYTGTAVKVTFDDPNNVKDTMNNIDHIEGVAVDTPTVQTGIEARYDAVILTTKDINKDKMTVIPVYGSDDDVEHSYKSSEFYIIRTSEFNELESNGSVTEDEVSEYEPVKASNSDLKVGQDTGTLSVTVIVFDENAIKGYFHTAVTVRIEAYSAKGYVEQVYGSYDNIVTELATLKVRAEELQKEIDEAHKKGATDADRISELEKQLEDCQKAYDELVETFADYIDSSNVDDTGYFDTEDVDGDGIANDIVYIDGEKVACTETEKETSDGKKIFTAEFDLDADESDETVYFYVDGSGVHFTDEEGNPIQDEEGKDIVYKDDFGASIRKMTAQMKAVEDSLKASEENLGSVIEELEKAGFEFDNDITVDQKYQAIIQNIKDLAKDVDSLNKQVEDSEKQVEQYGKDLDDVFNILTDSTLESAEITGVGNAISAIKTEVTTLKSELSVAQAAVADLNTRLTDAENKNSQLQDELNASKTDLSKVSSDLENALKAKDDLVEEYEKAIQAVNDAAAEELNAQIRETESAISELNDTKSQLTQKIKQIEEAQATIDEMQSIMDGKDKTIESLQAELEEYQKSADGFLMTISTANRIFDLDLSEDADIEQALIDYVQNSVNNKKALDTAEETIEAIQVLVSSNNKGQDLVDDVAQAIVNAAEGGSDNENIIDDSILHTDSYNFTEGYKAGIEASKNNVDTESKSYEKGQEKGYEAGLAEAATKVDTTSKSYEAGYAAGLLANKGTQSGSEGSNNNNSSSGSTNTPLTSGNNGSSNNSGSSNSGDAATIASLTAQVTTLTSSKTSLEDKVKKLEKEVDDLEDDVKDLEKDKKDLENTNSSLNSQVVNLKGQVSTLENKNSDLNTQVINLNSTKTSLEDKVSNLEAEVNSLNRKATSTSSTTQTTNNTSNSNTRSETVTTESESEKKVSESEQKSDKQNVETEKEKTTNEEKEVPIPDVRNESAKAPIAEESKDKLGKANTISLPSLTVSDTVESGQVATGMVIQLSEAEANALPVVNGSSGSEPLTENELNNAYQIMNYFSTHLSEFKDLGSEEVAKAGKDATKAVVITAVAAADVKPGDAQEAAINMGQSPLIEMNFDGITDGELYLVIHESEARSGSFDVILTKAQEGNIRVNLPDLSPITIANVSIKNVADVELVDSASSLTEIQNQEPNSSKLNMKKIVLCSVGIILFVVIIGAVVFLNIRKNRASDYDDEEDDDDEE